MQCKSWYAVLFVFLLSSRNNATIKRLLQMWINLTWIESSNGPNCTTNFYVILFALFYSCISVTWYLRFNFASLFLTVSRHFIWACKLTRFLTFILFVISFVMHRRVVLMDLLVYAIKVAFCKVTLYTYVSFGLTNDLIFSICDFESFFLF